MRINTVGWNKPFITENQGSEDLTRTKGTGKEDEISRKQALIVLTKPQAV